MLVLAVSYYDLALINSLKTEKKVSTTNDYEERGDAALAAIYLWQYSRLYFYPRTSFKVEVLLL